MSKIKAWISAARLRTLPLSISGILVGTALAGYYGSSNATIFWLAIGTTIGFQVTSNFANDYGDGIKGTDNKDRIGPKRVLQSGLLAPNTLKTGIIVSVMIDVLLVGALLNAAFNSDEWVLFLIFFILGGLSIWAAIKYTVGRRAYGYQGLGDVFVFLFFGLVGVLGSMFLFIKTVPWPAILPAFTVGLLSVGVLNLNNLRDYASDGQAGKRTLVVKMGFENGKVYHLLLLGSAFLSLVVFIVFTAQDWKNYISLMAFLPIYFHAIKIKRIINPVQLDPELKTLALSTFFMALLFYFSYNNFL